MHDGVDSGQWCLVVSLLFEPAARVAAQVEAPDLVVDEDRQHEGDSGQPPHEPGQYIIWSDIISYRNGLHVQNNIE